MTELDVNVLGVVSRSLPQAIPDNNEAQPIRLDRYRSQLVVPVVPWRQALADEGDYFFSTNDVNGTPTAITLAANVIAFADTNALFVIGNQDLPSNVAAKRIYLDSIKLLLSSTAPTATQSMEFALKRSQVSREPTTAANRTLLKPVNMASGSGRASIARVLAYANAGAMTVPASALNDPIVDRFRIPTGLGITGDEYEIVFGGSDAVPAKTGLTAVRASDPARIITNAKPVVIEPGEWLVIHMWWLTAATTAATFEFTLGHWER